MNESILIKDILCNGKTQDILIKDNKFNQIADKIEDETAQHVIIGTNKAIIPAFYNLHTHAGMNLLKGIADDKELFDWLNNDIWPREDTFNADIIYHGTKLAILEMIKTGTVGFFDMYFEQAAIMKAINDMGLRASVTFVEMDLLNEELTKQKIKATSEYLKIPTPNPEMIHKAIGVHAIYTASERLCRLAEETAKSNDMQIHIHVAETQKEVEDCQSQHGISPIELLDKYGLITDKTILAHAIFINDKDIEIIKEKGATLCTNPSSNLKLCSGMFRFQELLDKGLKITLGTDSSASNNNLSMLDEMKAASLVAKIQSMNPKAGKATDIFQTATVNGALALGFDAGVIAQDKLADCLLVDLDNPLLVPNYNLISNLVYSADSSVIDTVICNGKILMENRYVEGEEEIISIARKIGDKLK